MHSIHVDNWFSVSSITSSFAQGSKTASYKPMKAFFVTVFAQHSSTWDTTNDLTEINFLQGNKQLKIMPKLTNSYMHQTLLVSSRCNNCAALTSQQMTFS